MTRYRRNVYRVFAVAIIVGFGGFVLVEGKDDGSGEGPTPMNDTIEVFSTIEGRMIRVDTVEHSEEEWSQILSDEAYQVTRRHGTERAFSGAYWNHKEPGVYRCEGCGNDLFLSSSKFDSGTGWPSYSKPVHDSNVGTQTDRSWFVRRTEVHCKRCNAHLGHVFDDGPAPTGQRYCVNSAALKFVELGAGGD